MRPFSEEIYASLRRAVDVGYTLAGGISLFSIVTRPKVSTLSKYASDGDDNRETVMPIDVALDLDAAAKRPVITGRMAEILGFELVPKKDGPIVPRRVNDTDVLDIMSEAMDLVRAIQTARADGKICEADRKKIKQEIHELKRELDELSVNLGEG